MLLAPFLAVCVYVLLVVWLRRRTRGSQRALVVGLVVAVALLCVQRLVVTDQERLRAVCAELVEATEQGDVAAISRHVSERFAVRELDRAAFMEGVERTLRRYTVEDTSARVGEIEVGSGRAEVELSVRCRVVSPEVGEFPIPSAWRLVFAKEGEVWRLIQVDPKPTPLFDFDRLEEVFR